MTTKKAGLLRRLRRSERGATALEFSFVMPILVLLVLGSIEFSMIAFASALLEGGLREASRFGITGQVPEGTTREQYIVDVMNAHGNGVVRLTEEDVSVLTYPNFSKIGQPEPFTDENGNGSYDSGEPYTDVNCNNQWDSDMGLAGAGAGGEVVLYSVTYDLPLMTGYLNGIIGNDGKFPLAANVAVRNEPFEGGTGICQT